jgi:HK97 family phage major capsid protein
MKMTPRVAWSLIAILALFIAQALGYTASAEELSYGSAILVGIGDIELKEINDLLLKQGNIFEEFKRKNDERLEAIEKKGWAPADLTETVGKLSEAMQKLDKEILEIQKKANRLNPGGGNDLTDEQLEHKKAFSLYLRKGIDRDLDEIQRKAMNTGSDPDGGYLVLPEIDQMIDRIVPTVSALYRLANVVTIGTNKYQKRVKTSGMSMRRTADGSGGGETTEPKFANVEIEVFTAEVEPWVNNETLEDAFINLETDLADEAAIAFAEGAGSEFISGNGVGKARGITSYTNVANASYAWGKVGYIVSGKSAAFASVAPADKIVDLQHALKSQYRPGAVFLTNDATLGQIRQLKDGSGSYYLWQPDPAAAFGGRLLGHPVEVDDNIAALGAGSYSLAFGNFKRGYTIVNRTGTTIIRDNITTKGVTKFNFRRRFGGGITNFEAIKLMKFATS